MKLSFKQNGGTYRQVGDYNIPNLTLPPKESAIRLGKWGMLHKDYLLKNKKFALMTLLAKGKLWQYHTDIDTPVEQMKATEGVTEELKENNQMEWMHRMNNIKQCVIEMVNN